MTGDEQDADHNQLWAEVEPMMQEVQQWILTVPADDKQRLYLALSVASHAIGTAGALLRRLDADYEHAPNNKVYDDVLRIMSTMTNKLRGKEIN